jgi:sigma-B regulation protein RsbU (phosphoserine phosphatase)
VNWRFPLFVSLLAITVWYRGVVVWQFFVSPGIVDNTGLTTSVTARGTMQVERIDAVARDGEPSAAADVPIQRGDRIVAIRADGSWRDVESLFDYGAALQAIEPGEPWGLVVARPAAEGADQWLQFEMPPVRERSWPLDEWLLRIGLHLWLPLLAIAAGAIIGFARANDRHAFLAAMMLLSFSSMFYERLYSLPGWAQSLALFHRTNALFLTPYLFLVFFLVFPSRSAIERRAPWLKFVLLALTAAEWLRALVVGFSSHAAWPALAQVRGWLMASGVDQLLGRLATPLTAFMLVFGLVSLGVNLAQETSAPARRRLSLLLAGGAAGLVPLFLLALFDQMGRTPSVWFYVLMAPTLGLFPLTFAYVVIRHRVFGIRLILRRGLQYALLSRGVLVVEVVAIFVVLFVVASGVLPRLLPAAGPAAIALLTGLATILLVLFSRQVNRRLLPVIDRAFFRDAYNARRILIDLSGAVRRLTARPDELLDVVVEKIDDSLHPDGVAILLRASHWPLHCGPGIAPRPVAEPEPPGEARFSVCVRHGDEFTPAAGEAADPLVVTVPLTLFFEPGRDGEPRTIELWPDEWSSRRAGPPLASVVGSRLLDLVRRLGTRLVVPLVSGGEVAGLIALGGKRSEEPYTGEDKELLLAVAEQVAIALGYGKLIAQAAEQERMRREMEIARDVQRQLLPQRFPALRTLRYDGVCRPAQAIGGDYFDFITVSENRLGIALGDVAGKGVSAALLMAGLQATLRSHAPEHREDLGELVQTVNRLLCESMDEGRFATFFYGVYDDETQQFAYVNAGHNPPIVLGAQHGEHEPAAARARAVATADEPRDRALRLPDDEPRTRVRHLGPDNLVLGMFPDLDFQQRRVQLAPGDVLLIYSDGVSEAVDADGVEFGTERLEEALATWQELEPQAICEQILEELAIFSGDAPQRDDVTLIVAKVS